MHNVLIVGMGGIGYFYDEKLSSKFCYTHYKAFHKNTYFKVIGCVEKNITKSNYLKKNSNLKVYKSIKLVPKNSKIDIIIVATPTRNHFLSIKECVKYLKPKVILCEKPLAYKLDEAKKIISLCKKNKIKIFTNYIRLSDPSVIQIKQLIKKFKIKKITSWYTKDFVHNGSHVISLLQFWFGKILKINRILHNYSSNKNNDYLINFNNQQAYVLQGFAKDFEYFSIEMIGKFGRIRYDYGGEEVLINKREKDYILKSNFILNKKNKIIKNNFNKYQANVVNQLKNYFEGKKYFLSDEINSLNTNKIICLK